MVDAEERHFYQPGYLMLPFDHLRADQVVKPMARFIPEGVDLVRAEVDRVDADGHTVAVTDGRVLAYDYLVIATGTTPRPDQTPGMDDPSVWRNSVHEFYTYDGALALRDASLSFQGGRLVVHITERPIKCPVAPLEFALLAEDLIVDIGGHLFSCRMSADMMHIDESDLFEGVEAIINASDFIELTAGAQLLFI